MSEKKSEKFISQIVEANTREGAIDILKAVMEDLYLSSGYVTLVHLKDKLSTFKLEYTYSSDLYKTLETPRRYEDVHQIRVDLNFLYRDIADELSFEINRLKIFYEEAKTTTRAEAILSLSGNEEVQKKVKATSASALRDIVGADDVYKEYVNLASISYGLYQDLLNTLTSIRQMIDSIASEEKVLFEIEKRDVK